MELYISKNIAKTISAKYKTAKVIAEKTGKTVCFHFMDILNSSLFHGCSENQYLNEGFYKLRSFDRANTVTKERKNRICSLFNDGKYIKHFSNKALFNKTFSEFVKRDWIYTKEASLSELQVFVDTHNNIIVKPLSASKGKGIHLLDKSIAKDKIYQQYGSGDFLFEEVIVQHPDMQFGSKSVNTIRVISVVDKLGNVHILKAGLRCGVGEAITDNFSAGGVFYPLNLEGGFVEGYGEVNSTYDFSGIHPGTNIIMIGKQIPHWEKVLDMIIKAAKQVPQIRYVGWDVAILSNDVELIEGNNGPGCTLLECIGEKRGFYKEILSYL